MRSVRRAIKGILLFLTIAAVLLLGFAVLRGRPQDLPWTKLSLGEPVGAFTGRKLAALTDEFALCRALLKSAGIEYSVVSPVEGEGGCGYRDGIRFREGGSANMAYSPANLRISCPVAAALAMWEWNVVQPAAQRHFGTSIKRVEHLGSYSCRRIYGQSAGAWSEHSTADAVDIAGFQLADGTRVSLLKDWESDGPKAAFLREVRTGACRLFSTVLSPDYNAAHRDHFHFDQAERGAMGWRSCR